MCALAQMLSLDLEGIDTGVASASTTRAEDGGGTGGNSGAPSKGLLKLRKGQQREAAQVMPMNYAGGLGVPAGQAQRPKVGYVRLIPSQDLAVASSVSQETLGAVKVLASVLHLRDEWIHKFPAYPSPAVRPPSFSGGKSSEPSFYPFRVPLPSACDVGIVFDGGYFKVRDSADDLIDKDHVIPDVHSYLAALREVMKAAQSPACKTFCHKRLQWLEHKFNLHIMFNGDAELAETKANFHRDFYNVRKVDTHVHHSACMHQKHLLQFIRASHPEVSPQSSGGNTCYVLSALRNYWTGIQNARTVSFDSAMSFRLKRCARRRKFHEEGSTVVAVTPDGKPQTLRDVFQEELGLTDAEDLNVDLLDVHALGNCFQRFDLFNQKYNPFGQKTLRDCSLYHVYRKINVIRSFGDLLRNIFEPLFEAVKNPREHPEIFLMLQTVVGWDSVDDESVTTPVVSGSPTLPDPDGWTGTENPPYSYWAYYMYCNIRSLNHFLASRGLNTLAFRPHCGEAGSLTHLACMFLLADGVNHGIMLKKAPVLMYLYYLKQVGLAASPLSNNALFLDLGKNPLPLFFRVGMNVSLSTDDPLIFHFTDEALLEEYSIAAHLWKLNTVDLCELARNSVLQSGFEDEFKEHWLGPGFRASGCRGNCIRKTNVSNIRLQFRADTLREELCYMHDVLALRLAFAAANRMALVPVLAQDNSTLNAEKSGSDEKHHYESNVCPSKGGLSNPAEESLTDRLPGVDADAEQAMQKLVEAAGDTFGTPGGCRARYVQRLSRKTSRLIGRGSQILICQGEEKLESEADAEVLMRLLLKGAGEDSGSRAQGESGDSIIVGDYGPTAVGSPVESAHI
ncbi:amp deaminase [Cystoisospora suis]|uniref:AMP deaminase n=1 Tax=Cystoisospora suis TaxID=483139 RepID=A0A2C6KPA1_9APIC|nr:amp deaminase [Cystoisospora suis]